MTVIATIPAINEAGVFGDPATILPLDAVAELRVLSNYEAEYGRNSGAVINIVTKSGTNNWHGSLLEYFRSRQAGRAQLLQSRSQIRRALSTTTSSAALSVDRSSRTKLFSMPTTKASAKMALRPEYLRARSCADRSGHRRQWRCQSCVTAALLARNPWPTPNIASSGLQPGQLLGPGSLFDTGCPNGNNLSTSTSFFNRVDSAIVKIDHNFNANNHADRPLLHWRQHPEFPICAARRRPVAGFNTTTPTRVQLISLSYVKVVECQPGERSPPRMEPIRGRILPCKIRVSIPSSIGLDTGGERL